ncbi:50S ribosomal protein L11 methyltransferase [Nicoliella spurrieriana]|uniref:Ribosomal protein L11 methyltransferase n=1 Tax=Nicoliella spurrieriana TaxID=2925830 RepID=A0A976X5E8_9LACO|nr:50S ribosomal protein L11 methyltransferase [Nicoliella spurrieriana]UQS86522.1 50S ribosomal protein L11 methyltransferase [Nicoliella spurrieriana]
MEWQELTVKTNNEAVEAINNMLMEAGASGIQVDDDQMVVVIHAYFNEQIKINELIPELQVRIDQLTDFGLDPNPAQISLKPVNDDSWALTWEKYYHPTRLTRFLTVVPDWENYQPQSSNELIIRLNPGRAFGTGTHPTTILTLQGLETVIRGGESMLDVGTGSGVLSIAAKLMGVKSIKAFDLDEVAVKSALENINLNPVADDVIVKANNMLDGIDDVVDIIAANMLSDVIEPLIPQARKNLKRGGKMVISGIIKHKLPLIITTLSQNGFVVSEVMEIDDWRGIIATKPMEEA